MGENWKHIDRLKAPEGNVEKFVFKASNAVAEAVLYQYPSYKERTVICCSTQSGCPVGCRFCGAGDYFVRNLTPEEIVSQPVHLLELVEAEEEDLFPTNKKPTYHVDVKGAANVCDNPDNCSVKPYNTFTNVHSTDMDIVFGAASAFRANINSVKSSGEEPPKERKVAIPSLKLLEMLALRRGTAPMVALMLPMTLESLME